MELLLTLGGIGLLIWIARQVYNYFQPETGARTVSNPQPGPPSPGRKDVYRPMPPAHRRSPIVFPGPGNGTGAGAPSGKALEGLHDAFTGAPLNAALGLHQCSSCKVYYHVESVAVLREENAGRCVACGTAGIISLTTREAATSRGRDYNPDVVTLANYRSHFDRVITFEGKVRSVKVSRRGSDYAVMFEDTSWSKGLKLVFFRGTVAAVGGPAFIKGLQRRHIRVRGLLLKHPRFGPQIIISERGMILEIG
jgi:hypothetical protein